MSAPRPSRDTGNVHRSFAERAWGRRRPGRPGRAARSERARSDRSLRSSLRVYFYPARAKLRPLWDAHRQYSVLETRGDPVGVLTVRSEEHTSELQSRRDLVCRLLLEKKKK